MLVKDRLKKGEKIVAMIALKKSFAKQDLPNKKLPFNLRINEIVKLFH